MKKAFTILFIFIGSFIQAQVGNSSCANAIQICLTQPVTYPAAIGAGAAEVGPDYGCLVSANNPAWFLFRIGTPGTHVITETNSNARDLDYILFGPFTNPTGNCNALDSNNTAACSFAGGATETINFTSTTSGDYYLLLITNYSNLATNVTFAQISGTGNYDCEFEAVCAISLVTANPSTCDTLTNNYQVTGSVFAFNPPPTGTLTISNGIATQIINAPFANSTNYTLSALPSNGTTNTVTAIFSAAPTCTGSSSYTAPAGCIPCDVTVQSNSPVCEGGNLQFTTSFNGTAQYQWSGPAFFNSTSMNPTITNITASQSGTYTVLVTGQGCVAEREVVVTITPSQAPTVIQVGIEVCEGEILFLSALDVLGATYTWTGPNGFSATGRNAQIFDTTPLNSGDYILGMSINGCPNRYDTLTANIFPSPVIQIYGETIQNTSSTGVLYVTGAPGYTYFWNFTGNTSVLASSVYTSDRDSLIAFWGNNEGVMNAEVLAIDANGCQGNPVMLSIQIVNPLGVASISDKSGIQLFPNPANEFIQLKNNSSTNQTIRLLDARGLIIRSLQIAAGESTQLEVRELSAGLYFVESLNQHFPVVVSH
jgi:hypothetical protein